MTDTTKSTFLASLEACINQQASEYAEAMIKYNLQPFQARFVDHVDSRAVRLAFLEFTDAVRKGVTRERAERLAGEFAQRLAAPENARHDFDGKTGTTFQGSEAFYKATVANGLVSEPSHGPDRSST